MSGLLKACPMLASANIVAATHWYQEQLGFVVLRSDAYYGIVSRDGVEIHFWPCNDRKIAEATSAYIRVENIDALHSTMCGNANGGRMSVPEDRDWGMREFYVWDPDGNLLRFGQDTIVTQ